MSHSTLLPTETAELKAHADRAAKARAKGVQLLRDRRDGRHYATSGTTPGVRYYVTLVSCTCPGFIHHGYCKHHSAMVMAHLLQEHGDTPAPTSKPVHQCERCQDTGTVAVQHARWIGGATLGYRSQWTTEEPCPVCRADEYAHVA